MKKQVIFDANVPPEKVKVSKDPTSENTKKLIRKRKSQMRMSAALPMDEEIEAYEETVKKSLQKAEENKAKLENLSFRGEREILRIKTVFPFIAFPDEVIIDENKITVLTRQFFLTKNVRSILHKDIANVNVQSSFFFASLSIIDQYFSRDTITVEYLKKEDAFLARQLIQGLIVAYHQKVEVAQLPIEEAREKLIQIGKVDREMRE